jgi:hypothetical protein
MSRLIKLIKRLINSIKKGEWKRLFVGFVFLIFIIIFEYFVLSPQIEKLYQKMDWKHEWLSERLIIRVSFSIIILLLSMVPVILGKILLSKKQNQQTIFSKSSH